MSSLFSSSTVAAASPSALSPSIAITQWSFPGPALLFHPELADRRLSEMFRAEVAEHTAVQAFHMVTAPPRLSAVAELAARPEAGTESMTSEAQPSFC